MRKELRKIISDEELKKAFKGTTFIKQSAYRRALLAETLLNCACGLYYFTEQAMKSICSQLELYDYGELTEKGKKYLYYAYMKDVDPKLANDMFEQIERKSYD